MKKMSLPIRFHDCLSNSASSLQVTTVFHFCGSRGRVLLIFDSFESSFVQYLNQKCRMYVLSSLNVVVMPRNMRV